MVSLRVSWCLVFLLYVIHWNESLTVTKPFFNYYNQKNHYYAVFGISWLLLATGCFQWERMELREQHYSPFIRLVWSKDLQSLLSLWVDFNPNFMGRVSFGKRFALVFGPTFGNTVEFILNSEDLDYSTSTVSLTQKEP